MKQYVTRTGIPVEGGIEHPNCHDQDKTETNGQIEFLQLPYEFEGVNLAIITYDGTFISEQDLIDYGNIKPAFNLTTITELEANTFLANIGDITVINFEFIDNRPVEPLPTI